MSAATRRPCLVVGRTVAYHQIQFLIFFPFAGGTRTHVVLGGGQWRRTEGDLPVQACSWPLPEEFRDKRCTLGSTPRCGECRCLRTGRLVIYLNVSLFKDTGCEALFQTWSLLCGWRYLCPREVFVETTAPATGYQGRYTTVARIQELVGIACLSYWVYYFLDRWRVGHGESILLV